MAAVVEGLIDWVGDRDEEGHRNYMAAWLVRSAYSDGPAAAMTAAGLPALGSAWTIGTDVDLWAFCHPAWRATPEYQRERGEYWVVQTPFTTRPLRRCQNAAIEDPMMEPPDISGGFANFSRKKEIDRFGKPIMSSSHQPILGLEFDDGNPTVQIEMNTLLLGLEDFTEVMHHVNDAPMWGLQERMVKLSNVTWQRLLYGTCSYYFRRRFDFEINFETFDRNVSDRGTRCLMGWMPGSGVPKVDPDEDDPEFPGKKKWQNPKYFEVYKDLNGENTQTFLDGKGRPVYNLDEVNKIKVEGYKEANLILATGVPASLT